MTQIYKVAHLKNNIIETLYIYGGNKILLYPHILLDLLISLKKKQQNMF